MAIRRRCRGPRGPRYLITVIVPEDRDMINEIVSVVHGHPEAEEAAI